MHKLPKFGLLAPDGDTGASGAVAETANEGAQEVFAPNENNVFQESGSTAEPNGQGAATTQPATATTAPSSVTMSNEQLERLAQTMVRGMPQPQAQPQAPGPITPEQQAEFDRQFGVVRVTPEMYTQVFGVAPQNEAQLKALENMLHNVARMSNAMATYQMQQEMAKREQAVMSRFQPVQDFVNKQQATELETSFFAAAPDLKDFQGLTSEVIAAAKARGEKFSSREEAFTKLATRVRDYLTKARGGLPPPNGQKAAPRKTMPTTSMGGRTGSTNGSHAPVSGPQAVFGDMDT